MIRAGIYCRVSTDEQAKFGISLPRQREALAEFAVKNGYRIIDYYIDDGYTGTNLKRPALQRLLDDVRAQKLDIILVTKLDRWCRGVKNYYKLDDVLSDNKVHWKTILEDYDTSTASGKLSINIMLSIAENESATTSERIRFVFKGKLLKKEVVSAIAPLGLKVEKKKLVIDENTNPIIKDMYKTLIKTQSKRATRIEINKKYNLRLGDYTVSRLLKHPIYKGTYVGSGLVVEDFCEATVDEKTWDTVQEIISKNIKVYPNKVKINEDYIFSGLLKCKECGYRFVGRTDRRTRIPTHSYRCRGHFDSNRCPNNHSISETRLELKLISGLRQRLQEELNNLKLKNTIIDASPIEENKKLQKIDRVKINKQIENLVSIFLEGKIPKEIYDTKYNELMEKLALADKQDEEEKNKKEKPVDIEAIKKLLSLDIEERYLAMTNKEKRRFWRSIIKNIYYDQSMNVSYEFSI